METKETTPAEITPYVAPATFAKAKGIKYESGKQYDLTALGLGPHPQYGPIPAFTVTEAKPDGTLLVAEMACQGVPGEDACTETIEVHGGDLFQKRRCETHQRRFARRKSRPAQDPAAKEAKRLEMEATKLKKLTEREAMKAKNVEERNARTRERTEKKMADLRAKQAEADLKKQAAAAPKVAPQPSSASVGQ